MSVPQVEQLASERLHSVQARGKLARVGLSSESIQRFLGEVVGDDLHVKTILSLANATLGVLHAASLCIHVIGRAYGWATDGDGKHGVKQVDRLLSNEKVSPWALAGSWIKMLVGPREEVLVALDWTDFDKDDHTTLVASLITKHGRATPLLWKTVKKSSLAGNRNRYEDELLEHLSESMPEGVRTTILADRGFGDQQRYRKITDLGMDYVIRFREGILLTDSLGNTAPATEWLSKTGRAISLKNLSVTADRYAVPAIVMVRDPRMQDAWCLATSRVDKGAAEIVKWYGKRFTIEETFRDTKNGHLGMGLSATHIRNEARRDRLIFIAAVAHMLVTLLGAAGEKCGLDRTLKSNTSAKRQLSLYNQGLHWYMAIPRMREERLRLLIDAYGEVLREHELTRDLFGTL
jgi:Transposase DDE domain